MIIERQLTACETIGFCESGKSKKRKTRERRKGVITPEANHRGSMESVLGRLFAEMKTGLVLVTDRDLFFNSGTDASHDTRYQESYRHSIQRRCLVHAD